MQLDVIYIKLTTLTTYYPCVAVIVREFTDKLTQFYKINISYNMDKPSWICS